VERLRVLWGGKISGRPAPGRELSTPQEHTREMARACLQRARDARRIAEQLAGEGLQTAARQWLRCAEQLERVARGMGNGD